MEILVAHVSQVSAGHLLGDILISVDAQGKEYGREGRVAERAEHEVLGLCRHLPDLNPVVKVYGDRRHAGPETQTIGLVDVLISFKVISIQDVLIASIKDVSEKLQSVGVESVVQVGLLRYRQKWGLLIATLRVALLPVLLRGWVLGWRSCGVWVILLLWDWVTRILWLLVV